MPPFLLLDRLVKSFATGGAETAAGGVRRVLAGLTLAVERGEVVALLGPSGSGKTTALRLIAGFETPDPGGGRVVVEGQDVTALPPARRNFGMVFQHYALFPHLTVGENVAFGLEGRRLGREQLRSRVAAALALVDLPGFERRRVGEISGGQQQRVALARALAPEPRVLLLDEPLSNLDPALRERTRRELRRAIQRVGITTLLVTHEQEEAFHLGDRVAVLEGGVLHQVGTPQDLYDRPATRFVATFVGRASVLPGVFAGREGVDGAAHAAAGQAGQEAAVGGVAGQGGAARSGQALPAAALKGAGAGAGGEEARGETAPVDAPPVEAGAWVRIQAGASAAAAPGDVLWPGVPAELLAPGEAVELVVRPEALALVPAGTAGALAGRVAERRYAGSVTYYLVELPRTGIEIEVAAGATAAAPGDEVAVAPVAALAALAASAPATARAAATPAAGGSPPPAAPGRIFRRAAAADPGAPA